MRPHVLTRPAVLLPVLLPVLLGGCGNPFLYPGTWHATGVNEANLDTEAIDKRDTVIGHEDPGSDGVLDAAAVIRLHADQAKKLQLEDTQ